MKLVKDSPRKNSNGRRVTVDLEPGEELVAVQERSHYRLGGQMDDVVNSFTLTQAVPVFWNQHSQTWDQE